MEMKRTRQSGKFLAQTVRIQAASRTYMATRSNYKYAYATTKNNDEIKKCYKGMEKEAGGMGNISMQGNSPLARQKRGKSKPYNVGTPY
jgi:hypothetical protein